MAQLPGIGLYRPSMNLLLGTVPCTLTMGYMFCIYVNKMIPPKNNTKMVFVTVLFL